MKSILLVIGVLAIVSATQASPQNFIVNGINSNVNPHHVHVVYINIENAGFFGGGVIITPTMILTAAHTIVNFALWQIGVGSNNLHQLQHFVTTVALPHNGYVAATRTFDIGIIVLPTPLTFSANVRPAPLPPMDTIMPSTNEEGRAYGFGWSAPQGTESNVLQTTFQRVTNHTRCTGAFQFITTELSQFCAVDDTHGSNLCFGDLGGGLYIRYFGVDTLMGIASVVTGDCIVDQPTAYARVSAARPWIRQVAGV